MSDIKTIDRIKGTLEDGKPIGYSVAGIVVEAGEGVSGFSPGDRVAAAGAGLANHAEYVNVPVNLVTPIPPELDFAKASTVTLGTIALQGTRRCDLRLGEFCVVIGTGILGLLAVQILRFAEDGLWGKLSALGIMMILVSTSLVIVATLVGARFRLVESSG